GFKLGQTFARKRFIDFQAFILETLVPEASRRGVGVVKLILDNGTTHAPKQLQAWLDAQAQLNEWPFTIEVIWLPANASQEDLAQAIFDFIRCENQSPKPIRWTYTVEKLEKKLGMN
ncbi:MAG TPA: IS630 family transposase, partial [Anaerolineae bacterium]